MQADIIGAHRCQGRGLQGAHLSQPICHYGQHAGCRLWLLQDPHWTLQSASCAPNPR